MNTGSDKRGEAALTADWADRREGAATGGTADRGREERALGSRAPQFIRARRGLHLSWQVGVFVTGLAVVVAGVIMLPLPGPGWVVIFAGMAIWGTEFAWAQLVL